MTPNFPWPYSLLTKAGILTAGVVSLVLIGWPVADTRDSVESKSSKAKPTLADQIAEAGSLYVPDHESYIRDTRVDLNQGKLAELERLPGIGVVLAQRIIDHRQTHGRFQTVAALRTVSGIGEARIARLRPLVTVKQDKQNEKAVAS